MTTNLKNATERQKRKIRKEKIQRKIRNYSSIAKRNDFTSRVKLFSKYFLKTKFSFRLDKKVQELAEIKLRVHTAQGQNSWLNEEANKVRIETVMKYRSNNH